MPRFGRFGVPTSHRVLWCFSEACLANRCRLRTPQRETPLASRCLMRGRRRGKRLLVRCRNTWPQGRGATRTMAWSNVAGAAAAAADTASSKPSAGAPKSAIACSSAGPALRSSDCDVEGARRGEGACQYGDCAASRAKNHGGCAGHANVAAVGPP